MNDIKVLMDWIKIHKDDEKGQWNAGGPIGMLLYAAVVIVILVIVVWVLKALLAP